MKKNNFVDLISAAIKKTEKEEKNEVAKILKVIYNNNYESSPDILKKDRDK